MFNFTNPLEAVAKEKTVKLTDVKIAKISKDNLPTVIAKMCDVYSIKNYSIDHRPDGGFMVVFEIPQEYAASAYRLIGCEPPQPEVKETKKSNKK